MILQFVEEIVNLQIVAIHLVSYVNIVGWYPLNNVACNCMISPPVIECTYGGGNISDEVIN